MGNEHLNILALLSIDHDILCETDFVSLITNFSRKRCAQSFVISSFGFGCQLLWITILQFFNFLSIIIIIIIIITTTTIIIIIIKI